MERAIVRMVLAILLAGSPGLAPAGGPARVEARALGGWRTFAQKTDRDVLDGGPAYGVALEVGLLPWVAIEGAYVGSTFHLQSGFAFGTQRVLQNDAWAVLKLGPRDGAVRPYVFGGAGWTWLQSEPSPGYVRDQEYLVAPVGAGIDFALGSKVTLGLRGVYELGFERNAVSAATTSARTDEVMLAAELGARF